MKKLCLLLALALALSTMPAFAAQGDMLLGREEENYLYFNYGFPMGGDFYLASGYALYIYHLGETDLEERAISVVQRENGYEQMYPFAVDDALYAVGLASSYDDESSSFEGATLYKLASDDEADYVPEAIGSLDWDDLVEYYDQSSYATQPESLVCAGSKVFFRAYDQNGDYQLYMLDVDRVEVSRLDAVRNAYNMCLYRDGTLLVQSYSYSEPSVTRLFAFDPDSESIELLAELEVDDYSPLNALAYDAETDTIYCAQGGELCPLDLATGEIGEGVTDMPLETYGNSAPYVLPGGYFIYGSEGLVVRNLDPEQRADIRLKINDSSWDDCVTNAYYRFSNAHGDVSVVLSRDWNEAQNLVEKMMNRDDSVDIYVLPSTSGVYDALYRRGYLMELDGSAELTALAEGMYADLREAVSTDGHLVALPVAFYGWTIGVNEQPLQTLGYTLEDIPDNWMDLLDFIAGLEQPLADTPNVHLFYAGYTAREARNDLFNSMFEDYERYVNSVNPDAGYNSPLLRELITKLEAIDFVALGCAEDSEGDYQDDGLESSVMMVQEDYSEDSILFSAGVGCTFGSYYSNYTPLMLGLDADTPMPLVLRADLMFINPYTKNPDMALAFVEAVADNLNLSTLYTLDPTLNEPVRGAHNEENLVAAQEWVDSAQQSLDEAEPADKQMWEEGLRNAQENLEYWEEYGWDVSQREIDWFRGHDDNLTLDRVNWLYADDSGDAWDLINQYLDGAIGVDEMLAGIDRKAQMMRLEGN